MGNDESFDSVSLRKRERKEKRKREKAMLNSDKLFRNENSITCFPPLWFRCDFNQPLSLGIS